MWNILRGSKYAFIARILEPELKTESLLDKWSWISEIIFQFYWHNQQMVCDL